MRRLNPSQVTQVVSEIPTTWSDQAPWYSGHSGPASYPVGRDARPHGTVQDFFNHGERTAQNLYWAVNLSFTQLTLILSLSQGLSLSLDSNYSICLLNKMTYLQLTWLEMIQPFAYQLLYSSGIRGPMALWVICFCPSNERCLLVP